MGGKPCFVSHPEKALLAIHDPDRFGCSPCHNGNGLATSSAEKAHGNYEHWLWPMFAKANAEAGCLQCHSATACWSTRPRSRGDATSSS